MKSLVLAAGFAALSFGVTATSATAGPIQSACMSSGRSGATPGLCSCIQQVADITLRGSDQRKAASFFRDPDKAQQVHMSKTRADDDFWDRYVIFGQQAAMACAG